MLSFRVRGVQLTLPSSGGYTICSQCGNNKLSIHLINFNNISGLIVYSMKCKRRENALHSFQWRNLLSYNFYSSISISGSLYFHSTTFYLLTLDISYFADYKVLVPNNIISLLLLFVWLLGTFFFLTLTIFFYLFKLELDNVLLSKNFDIVITFLLIDCSFNTDSGSS